MTFNIESQSEFNVIRDGGSTYGVRMYGGNNVINVKSGGKFYLNNITDSENGSQDGAEGDGAQGIFYVNGTGNQFNVEGYPESYTGDRSKKSEVTILANNGPAIYSLGDISIYQGEDTIFRATGSTLSNDVGIFNMNSQALQFTMSDPNYFEFTNLNTSAPILNTANSNSKFDFSNSDLAVWMDDNSEYDKNPSYDWNYLSANISGSQLSMVDFASDTQFKEVYNTAQTHKMTANNAAPYMNEFIVPTNADKVVQGHVYIPVGNDENGRDAWDNEVYVDVNHYNQSGDLVDTYEKVMTHGVEMYDGKTRQGIFTINLDRFLIPGETFEVVRLWRAADSYDNPAAKIGTIATGQEKVTTIDVTPPNPATIDQENVWENTNVLTGTWSDGPIYNPENPILVFAVLNNDVITENGEVVYGTINNDHTWSYNIPDSVNLNPEDTIYIILEDMNGLYNPLVDTVFHAATFEKAPSRVVQEVTFNITGNDVIIGLEEAESLLDENELMDRLNAKGHNSSTEIDEELEILSSNYEAKAGRYEITVAIKQDNSYTKKFEVVVLDETEVIVGDEYVIAANSIVMNSHTASTITNEKLVELTQASAYKTSDVLSGVYPYPKYDVKVETHNVSIQEGSYYVTFVSIDEEDTKITVGVEVDNGEKPVLEVTSPYKVPLYGSFNPLDGVTYSDKETPTEKLELTYSADHVNTYKPGQYLVNYSVVDEDYNITTATRIVIVGGGIQYDDNHTLEAYDFVILTKDVDVARLNAQLLEKSQAKSFNTNTAQKATPKIIENDGYTNEEGTYTVIIGIEENEILTKEITVYVVNGDKIVNEGDYYITSKNFSINTTIARNINENDDTNTLLELGNSQAFKITDAGSEKLNTSVKNYSIKNVQSNDNTVTYSIDEKEEISINSNVSVTDGTAPSLNVTTPIYLELNQELTEDIVKEGVTYSDLETPYEELVLSYDISGVNTSKPGQYKVTYSVTDTDFNTTEAVRIFIVGKGIVNNGKYTLEGYDFVILAQDVKTSDINGQILEMSKASALKLSDGSTAIPMVSNNDGYSATEGVYEIILSVEEDQSLVKKIKAYVMDGENITRNGNYFVTAKNFKINTTQAESITTSQMLDWGNAKAVYIDDEGSKVLTPEVSDYSITTTQNNTHWVEYKVNHTETFLFMFTKITGETKVRNQVTVTDGEPPVIEATTPIVLNIGDIVDYMAGVTYSDIETPHESLVINREGEVDTSKPGQYKVVYSVTDEDYNTTEAIRIYIVGGRVNHNDKFTLEGYNFVILSKHVDELDIDNQILTLSKAKSYNLKTGITADVEVIDNDGYSSTEGTYNIILGVKDDSSLTKEIKVTVVDGDDHVTDGDYHIFSKNFQINTTTAKTIENDEIIKKANVKAYKISDNDTVELDPYVIENDIIGVNGTYSAKFGITENSNINATSVVSVSDGDSPNLSISTPIQLEINQSLTKEIALSGIDYSDTEDEKDQLKLTYDDSNVDTSKPGIYKVTYTVEDTDFNKTSKVRTYLVGDGVYDSEYTLVGYDYIILAKDVTVTNPQKQILSMSKANAVDLVTGKDVSPIITNLGGYTNKEGTYTITLSIQNHESLTKEINVYVVDGDNVYPSNDGVYSIVTKNFKINTTVADSISIDTIKELSNVKAYEITDKGSKVLDTFVVKHNIIGTTGEYSVEFGINQNLVKGYSKVFVSDGNAPILTVETPIVLEIGTTLTEEIALKGVEYSDTEDEKENLILSYDDSHVDTSVGGIYTVEYVVQDTDYNTTSQIRTYLVGPGSANNDYVLVGYDFVILTKDVDTKNPNNQILELSHPNAIKLSDGSNAEVIVLENDGYTNQEGTYNILLGVKDDVNLTINVKAKVVNGDNIFPDKDNKYFITTKNISINTTVAKNMSDADLLSLSDVKAFYVNELGIQSLNPLVVSHNIDSTEGTYTGLYGIQENDVKGTNTIIVDDGDAPNLKVTSPIKLKLNSDLTEKIALDGVDYSDTETSVEDLILTYDDSQVDTTTPGQYRVNYTVEDTDYNKTTKTRIYIVGEGTDYNEDYTLSAYDFVILSSDVDEENIESQILKLAKVESYKLVDGTMAHPLVFNPNGYSAEEGIYEIEIGIEEDDSLTKIIKAHVVDGDNIVRDGNYILTSKNFKINSFQASNISDSELLVLGNVKAIYLDDSGSKTLNPYVNEFKINTNIEEEHWVEYAINHEESFLWLFSRTTGKTTIRSNILVTDGEAPSLSVSTPIELALGQELTQTIALDGVSYSDKETPHNELVLSYDDSKVDTNIAGIYQVEYSVEDTDHNVTKAIRTYIVGSNDHDDRYALVAYDYVILAKDVDTSNLDTQILALSKAKAVQLENGKEVTPIVVSDGGYSANEGTYSVVIGIDGYGTLTRTITINVVSGDNVYPSLDGKYLITTKDFEISTGYATKITDQDMIKLGNVKAFFIDDKETTVLTPYVISNNIENIPNNNYTVTYGIQENAIQGHSIVKVSSGNVPVLEVVNPIELAIGENFDPLFGVTYSDQETPQEKLLLEYDSSTVNINVAGIYYVTYSVTDEDGNTVTKLRLYIVNDGNYLIKGNYILHAKSYSIPLETSKGSDAEILENSEARAWDIRTGKEVTTAVSNSDGYRKEVGEYNVEITVQDAIEVNKQIVATIYSEDKPNSPSLPSTGVTPNNYLYLYGLIVIIGAILFSKDKYKSSKRIKKNKKI